MEDNESDSYDEIKIDNLKKELLISKSQLLQISYNEGKVSVLVRCTQ